MSRELKIIKLSNCDVEVITSLTWGEKERLQGVFLKGAKVGAEGLNGYDMSILYEAKVKLMELAIVSIKTGEEVSKFSVEWVENLSAEDGDKLYDELEKLNKKKQ